MIGGLEEKLQIENLDCRTTVRFLRGVFPISYHVQTGSETRPAYYPMCSRGKAATA